MAGIKCSCGGVFRKETVEFEGFDVEALKCSKCGEKTFTPVQFKKVLELRESAKEINSVRKIVRIGNSLGITLPKGIKGLGLKAGSKVKLRLENKKTIELALV
jgi:hypothetical protein